MDAKKLASFFDNPRFAEWFGDSKVVSRPGRPMSLYRGISKNVEDRHPSSGLGTFMTADRGVASSYAGDGGELLEVMASIKNPYTMDSMALQNIADETSAKKMRAELEGSGYDGIFVKPIAGAGAHPGHVSEYIAFEPTQIKSVNNRGTFDPNDPNIYRAALPFVAGAGLMSAMSPNEAEAAQRIRAKDAPLEDAWSPIEAFAGGLPGGIKAAAMGILPDGAMDWAFNKIGGLMSGGK